jgi:hypothetical protein
MALAFNRYWINTYTNNKKKKSQQNKKVIQNKYIKRRGGEGERENE